MSEENYLINSTSVKVNEPSNIQIPNQIHGLTKQIRSTDVSSSVEYEKQKETYLISSKEDDITELNNIGQYKKCRRSVDSGIGHGGYFCYQDQLSGVNGSASKILCHNIRTVNFCQSFGDQNRDITSSNNLRLVANPAIIQDLSNMPSNSTTYSINGTQINKIKTANSSGSSFLIQTHPSTVTSLSQLIYASDINDLRNQAKIIKSQNVAFTQKTNDASVGRKMEDDSLKGISNSKVISYIGDSSLNYAEYHNPSFGSSNKISGAHVSCRRDSVLSAPPDYYESDQCGVADNFLQDNGDINCSGPLNREEVATATDFQYANNLYVPTINVNETRNNAISYIRPAIPVVVLNSNVNQNTRHLNTYPQFCLAQLVSLSNDTINQTYSNIQEQRTDDTESFVLLQNDIYLQRKLIEESQQFSSNNESFRNGPEYNAMSVEDESSVLDQTTDLSVSAATNNDHKIVIKCAITPTTTGDKSPRCPELTFDGNAHQYLANDELNMNTNSGSQLPRSRFKKTRIRETIERWCVNGLNTYDCRFKVIPSKIMNLRNASQDLMTDDCLLQSWGDRDTECCCYSLEYNNKEFRFWDSGDRIAICGKSDYETETYCQFHAKYINLINQNQNLSLSKFVPQSVLLASNSFAASSSPQIIRAVLISSPDNDNYTMNIDTNLPQNVALSAPPVSPSIITSVPISCMPFNLHSPQPAASMVMLRCQTPVILSSAARSATLMHESISIERINHKTSSKMSLESDSATFTGHQSTLAMDQDALVDMWSSCTLKPDHIALKLPPHSSTSEPMLPPEDTPRSFYSLGTIPHILYSIQQPAIPSMSSPGYSSGHSLHHTISNPSSVGVMHEIDRNMNSLKSLIHSLIQSEQQPLINEITTLVQANEGLRLKLAHIKQRSEFLETVLRDHHIHIDHDTFIAPGDISPDHHYHYDHRNNDHCNYQNEDDTRDS